MTVLLLVLLFQADSLKDQDLSSMSLEELLNLNVVTASKKEESAWDATAVVTVISSQEIEMFGGSNLFEVLDRIPGLQSLISPGVDRVTVRGGEPNLSANHILYLIDGRPLRTSGGNLAVYSALHSFPLSIIERIEVVRGPGSVLYGTNAMEGVINIITKGDAEAYQLRLKGGSNSQKSYDVELRQKLGGWMLEAGLFYNDTEGWDYITPVAPGVFDSKAVFDDSRATRVSLSNENWNISLYGSKVKEFSFASFLPSLSYHSDVWMGDLGYKKNINDKWTVESHATLNKEEFVWMGDPHLELLPFDTQDMLLETTVFGQVSDKLELTMGAVAHDIEAINLAGLVGTYFKHEGRAYSAYGQLRYRSGNKWDLLVGAQYNQVVDFDSDLVPRLSANYKHSDKLTYSLFYGGAFRSPLGLELNIDTPGVQRGNPNLKSEHVKTLEGRMFYHKDNTQVSVTVFQSTQEDLIRLVPTAEYTIGVHENFGEIQTTGLEVEARLIKDNWYWTGSFTTQQVEDEAGNKDVTHAPKYHLKLGVGYNAGRFGAGLFIHASDSFKHTSVNDGWLISLTPESEPFQLASLNLGYDFSLGKRMKARWEVYGANLLDEEVHNQDFLYSAYNSMPGWAPRTYNTSVKLSF